MYDDTASGDNDVDWVELHNTRSTPVNIGDWYLSDGSTYPNTDGEGVLHIRSGTTIQANGYIILSKVPFSAAAEVVCTEINPSWVLGNNGDNLALFSNTTSAPLVDGLLIGNYPDLAAGNSGTSVEKRSENVAWTSAPTAWGASTNENSITGCYRFCIPDERNPVVASCLPPDSVSIRWEAGYAEVRFISEGGSYEIDSTGQPSNDGDPSGGDPQWNLRLSANYSIGQSLWTDTNVTDAYRNCVFLKACP